LDRNRLARQHRRHGYDFPEAEAAEPLGLCLPRRQPERRRDAATDTPIANATVELLNAAGVLLQTTTTNAGRPTSSPTWTRWWSTPCVNRCPTLPAGLVNGPVNPGLINGLACATGCTAQAAGSPAGAGSHRQHRPFGRC
jgi:hypothetical protein